MQRHINKYKSLHLPFFADRTLDFHDYSSLLPYDVETILTRFIEDAYVAGAKHLLIITGKGKIVRPLVTRILQKHKQIASFKQAGYFNGQSGAFEVELIVPIN